MYTNTPSPCIANVCLRRFLLTPWLIYTTFILVLPNFQFNALWLSAHSDAVGRVRVSRRRTKLRDCVLSVKYISHCAPTV